MSPYHFIVNVLHVNDTFRIRITPSTDTDWYGTATEQTDINLFSYSSIYILKVLSLYLIYVLANKYPPFQQIGQYTELKMTRSKKMLKSTAVYRA